MKNRDNKQLTDKEKRYKARREYLTHMSIKARQFRDKKAMEYHGKGDPDKVLFWECMRVNDIIANWYREESGAKEFKTFLQWKELGYSIKKGSKAYLLWSKKRQATTQQEPAENGGEPEENEYEFFPIAYLFSDLQIELTTERNGQETQTETPEKEQVVNESENNVFVID